MSAENATRKAAYAAGAAAREAARQTPEEVRNAMLAGPRMVCGLELQPLSFDILWLLEQAGHPIAMPGNRKTDAEGRFGLSPLETAELVFAFADPDAALAAASVREADAKLSRYSREALAFMRRRVRFTDGAVLTAAIFQLVEEGLSTAPGAAAENPPPDAERATRDADNQARANGD